MIAKHVHFRQLTSVEFDRAATQAIQSIDRAAVELAIGAADRQTIDDIHRARELLERARIRQARRPVSHRESLAVA